MSKQPNMTEPMVIPSKPKVKPTPQREVKPVPRRGDPWTVPGPKKNPTPKAENTKVMTKENTKKTIVKNKAQLDFYKLILTKEQFHAEFVLSPELQMTIKAERLIESIGKTDRIATPQEMKALFS